MTFCPLDTDKYCPNPTLKLRYERVSDWLAVFNAIVNMRPTDIPVRATIDHNDAIRRAAKETLEKITEEMEAEYERA